MLRSEAARYARWSALIALVLAGITTAVFLERGWVRHLEKKKAPPPAPVDVSRQSVGINFKKHEGNQTIFEVAASHSTEFKGEDANLLEDVKITIFGKAGDRHDVIHTQSCRYGKENGGIVCGGEVNIDLLSAQDAARTVNDPAAAAAVTTHVETRGVRFDRASGLAQTDQQVRFTFPSGSGSAVGLEYQSEAGTLRLLQDVRFTLVQNAAITNKKPAPTQKPGPPQQVRIRGTRLDFGRDSRLLRLHGPAEAETPAEHLSGTEISLVLDKDFHAETLTAAGSSGKQATVNSQAARDNLSLSADTLTARFAPEGWLTKLDAAGAVHAMRVGLAEQDDASADSGTVDLWPKQNQPKEVNLRGHVLLKTHATKTGDQRTLQTTAFRMQFSEGEPGVGGKVQRAETLAAGTMEWTDLTQPGGSAAKTKLQADKLAMDFTAQGKARQLVATGNVQTERSVTGRPLQTATGRNGTAELQPAGGWSQMDLDGDVRLREEDRTAQGDHAVFLRASQTATITGHAVARDAVTETHAPKIIFAQTTGDIRAEGGVRSTDFSSKGSAVQLAPAPVNITANTLQANSKAGRALYSGKARLWQGDSVLEADSVELLRESRTLNALGNVRAVFPQAPRQTSAKTTERAGRPDSLVPTSATTPQRPSKKPQLWHATCGSLNYRDLENRAHLEQNVIVQSAEQRMRAPVLDLYFQRAPQNPPSTTGAANSVLGAQQISRAVGSGGVVVEEGTRRAVAEHGEYSAVNGQFVMSGGNPTLYDGSAGTTTGRQLTFFLADDTIIVDSENGSRTVTKHRVEK